MGKIYKNYPELCKTLCENITSSDSKIAQLKEWSRFFEWERIGGHKYKITKIYDHPKPKDDTHNKSSTYATAAYAILLNELLAQYEKSIWVHQNVDEKAKIEKFPKQWYKK